MIANNLKPYRTTYSVLNETLNGKRSLNTELSMMMETATLKLSLLDYFQISHIIPKCSYQRRIIVEVCRHLLLSRAYKHWHIFFTFLHCVGLPEEFSRLV